MYRLLVNDIPEGTNATKGTPISALISFEPEEKATIIYSIYRDTNAKYVLFTTKQGLVKKTPLEEYIKTKKKSGMGAINIREGDELASVTLIDNEEIILLTSSGMGIRFDSADISPTGRLTSGVKGINLKEEDYIVATLPIRDMKDSIAIFGTNCMGKRVPLTDLPIQKRGGKGVICHKETIADGALVSEEDKILVLSNNSSICIEASELPVLGRGASGNQVIKQGRITSVSKV